MQRLAAANGMTVIMLNLEATASRVLLLCEGGTGQRRPPP
jgi:hypothetical protein